MPRIRSGPNATWANPFATRFIRPGALSFHFPKGESVEMLVARLEAHGGWGQITGPHGSGKSTLLTTLIPALEAAGKPVRLITLRAGVHRLPALRHSELPPGGVLVVDGYEQLSWWARRRLKSFCRRSALGLVVTAHADAGLPPVYRVEPSLAVMQTVADQLQAKTPVRVSPAEIAAAFEATGGNARETLFRLYDVAQQRALESETT